MSLPSIYVSSTVAVKPIPFRLRVLRALTSAIETVNPDNGYHYDLRDRVFRGRMRFGGDDPVPMVSVLEAPLPADNTMSDGQNPNSIGAWELLIQGWAEDDMVNPSDPAHHLMAEVKAALVAAKRSERGTNILGMQGRVFDLKIGQGTVRPGDEPSAEAFFWLTLTMRVAEDLDQPYA